MRIDKAAWGNLYPNGWALDDVTMSDADRVILRGLAEKLARLAARPSEADKTSLWTRHNDLEDTRPLILVDAENGWNEIIQFDRDIRCTGIMAQDWEMWLRKEIYWGEVICDDKPLEPIFYVPFSGENPEWGIEEANYGNEDAGKAYSWKPILEEYGEEQFSALDVPDVIPEQVVVIDHEASDRAFAIAKEVFDGILEVRWRTWWFWSSHLLLAYAHYRGLQTMMMDFYDYPDKVHEMMTRLTDTYIRKIQQFEREGVLTSNVGNSFVGSAGLGHTTALERKDPPKVRLLDTWGMHEAQEASGISQKMFREFIFPHQLRVSHLFGLNCYACCEPVDPRWELVQTIPRLRRVSVSQWADAAKMCEYLGRDYIYSYKASSSAVAIPSMSEDGVRAELRTMLERARAHDNRLEIILKDLHTLGGRPDNITRWVRIAREEIARTY